MSKKSSKPRGSRKAVRPADYAAREPEPPLMRAPALDPAQVRIGAVVQLSDGRQGRIKALGAHRLRLLPATGDPVVVERTLVERILQPAAPAKSSGKSSRPKVLRLRAEASVAELAGALAAWDVPAERLLAALKQAVRIIEAE